MDRMKYAINRSLPAAILKVATERNQRMPS
jgi:hypothetical protein